MMIVITIMKYMCDMANAYIYFSLLFYIDILRMGMLPKSYKDCISANQMFEI